MQYRSPVGCGPSSNTCPRCPPHPAQCTSVRTISQLRSTLVATACSRGRQKLGQPVPLSNFVLEANSSRPHPAHLKTPSRCSRFKGLVKGCSVACRRSTRNCAADNVPRHSSSVCMTGNGPRFAADGPVSHPTIGTNPTALASTTRNCRLWDTPYRNAGPLMRNHSLASRYPGQAAATSLQ